MFPFTVEYDDTRLDGPPCPTDGVGSELLGNDSSRLSLAGRLGCGVAGRSTEADAVEREARRIDPSEEMRAALEKARGRVD